jgi:hypothetical protein
VLGRDVFFFARFARLGVFFVGRLADMAFVFFAT